MTFTQPQVKLDEAQEKEQDALKGQLKQEEELLKEYQIKQESKLVEQLKREKIAQEERVEASKRHLEKEVSGGGAMHVFCSSHDPHTDVRGECKTSEHKTGATTRVTEETA